ncbi:low molecular weight phosphotyrosine protein phosphatase [Cuneatibacter sp. NSJ-177]|uniref:low molecular weight protein-tyrosine-phosphatase n=1 Tax=Cuneatibacter sp. NSJ-177 TaxID=2931401 RepID=UPI001FD07F70|nr:low molecular weight protein-tyrosine-phosphatase [Cuneatibacter sp. NSJ-177]MCJ7835346.1 low molecular weight phosphotyrosine protein phosphatase [Cuneatibacter sp. NSJ-177]
MIKILFICHGNICRSPMAEFVFLNLVKKAGCESEFEIDSAATSREEIGNPVHPGTLRKLAEQGVPVREHRARQMTRQDYQKYDYLIGMDAQNLRNMLRILGGDPEGKVKLLLDFTGNPRDIADPWYTGNFDATYEDIREGCEALLRKMEKSFLTEH